MLAMRSRWIVIAIRRTGLKRPGRSFDRKSNREEVQEEPGGGSGRNEEVQEEIFKQLFKEADQAVQNDSDESFDPEDEESEVESD